MQKLFLFALILCMVACTKSATDVTNIASKRPFFKDADEAFSLVKCQVKRFHAEENLKSINRISYMYSGNKVYAFVSYSSNTGNSNLVITKSYVNDVSTDVTVTKCSGGGCDCYVNTVVSNSGNISVSCSCTSCTMTINNGLE